MQQAPPGLASSTVLLARLAALPGTAPLASGPARLRLGFAGAEVMLWSASPGGAAAGGARSAGDDSAANALAAGRHGLAVRERQACAPCLLSPPAGRAGQRHPAAQRAPSADRNMPAGAPGSPHEGHLVFSSPRRACGVPSRSPAALSRKPGLGAVLWPSTFPSSLRPRTACALPWPPEGRSREATNASPRPRSSGAVSGA